MAKKVIEVLMERDNLTREEALARVEDCRSELYDALDGTSCLDPEEVLMEELGLEMDFIFDLI